MVSAAEEDFVNSRMVGYVLAMLRNLVAIVEAAGNHCYEDGSPTAS